jgi:hypothetical protein
MAEWKYGVITIIRLEDGNETKSFHHCRSIAFAEMFCDQMEEDAKDDHAIIAWQAIKYRDLEENEIP